MTWTLTPFGKTRIALPGVPWRDLTDEEYEAAVARHPGMETQGYFARAPEEPEPAPRHRRGRLTESEPVEAAKEAGDE